MPFALRTVGKLLTANDAIVKADAAIVTPESGAAGELEAVTLFESGLVDRIILVASKPQVAERELLRRGIDLRGARLDRLRSLGIPPEHVDTLEGGEGGTTDSTAAIATLAGRTSAQLLVIASPSHVHRVRRALERQWPDPVSAPAVLGTRYHAFRSDDWWRERSTLREGIVEIEKLLLDYLRHPLS
ncbi:MAG: hypothetical protein AB7P99_14725 [Vicinamibacterales bacterium]